MNTQQSNYEPPLTLKNLALGMIPHALLKGYHTLVKPFSHQHLVEYGMRHVDTRTIPSTGISIDEVVRIVRSSGETLGNLSGRTPYVPVHNYRGPSAATFRQEYGKRHNK